MIVNHSKIFKKEDGGRVRVTVTFSDFNRRPSYRCTVGTCEPKKRTWFSVCNTDAYDYRALSMEQRALRRKNITLLAVTPEEIAEVKNELWAMLSPEVCRSEF